jgi:hypothetical protein
MRMELKSPGRGVGLPTPLSVDTAVVDVRVTGGDSLGCASLVLPLRVLRYGLAVVVPGG